MMNSKESLPYFLKHFFQKFNNFVELIHILSGVFICDIVKVHIHRQKSIYTYSLSVIKSLMSTHPILISNVTA